MEHLSCIRCESSLPIASSLKDWTCKPCSQGVSPEDLTCELCGLSDGLFQQSSRGWVHFFCSSIFSSSVVYSSPPTSTLAALHSTVEIDLVQTDPCSLCNSSFPTVQCVLCKDPIHIACLLERNWLIDNSQVYCGCHKCTIITPIRSFTSLRILENLLLTLTKADISGVLSSEIPSLAQKKTTINIVEDTEPLYIESFFLYENQRKNSLSDLFDTLYSCFSATQLSSDLKIMFQNKLDEFPEHKHYLHQLEQRFTKIIKNNDRKIREALKYDWEHTLELHKHTVSVKEKWNKQGFSSRKYTTIEDYAPVDKDTCPLSRLSTSLEGSCDGNYCSSLSDLGPLDLSKDTWSSSNPDRTNKIECSSNCQCSPSKCKNRQISQGQNLILGKDLMETPTWGFDNQTFQHILSFLKHPLMEKQVHSFIDNSLTSALNAVRENNYDIRNALLYILNAPEFPLSDKRYAWGLLRALRALITLYGETQVLDKFKIHSKGTGVVCLRPDGIPENSLIIEYFGEIYSPARWFEKQDIIKKSMRKDFAHVPDFYNIFLERHKIDKEGYDLVMVDPIIKGSFGSRLSHSCMPNCGTVTMVSNQRYTVGMYALKSIGYMEELTFDYVSFTENLKEHQKAVCLCASPLCRGYYLEYTSQSICAPSSFVHRLSIILKASVQDFPEKLDRFNFGKRSLEGAPSWLGRWTGLVLERIEGDEETTENRLRNLAITIDKVKYCLKGASHPPLRLLTLNEILEYLWGDSGKSVKGQVWSLKIPSLDNVLNITCETVEEARNAILKIRDALRELGTEGLILRLVADILHFVAYTKVYFTENLYDHFEVQPVAIRNCEVMKDSEAPHEEIKNACKKVYARNHVHGSLIGWFKHTVEKPSGLYTNGRQGTVIFPRIDKCPLRTGFDQEMRMNLLEQVKNYSYFGLPLNKKSKFVRFFYSNNSKVFGSPMFDSEFLEDDSLDHCLSQIDENYQFCNLPPLEIIH